MRKLAASTDSKSMVIWNIATPTYDCPNWIARWFLYHKFRYRDGRKWHFERDGTQLEEDIDGNDMEIQEKHETDQTTHGNTFGDPSSSTAQEDPHEVLSSMNQTRDQNMVKEGGHTAPSLTPQDCQPFRPISPNSFQRALLQKRFELEGTETTSINETNTIKPSSSVEAEVHNLDSKKTPATFSDAVVRWRSTICLEDNIDKDSTDDDTEYRAGSQVTVLNNGKNLYTDEPQAPPDRDFELPEGQVVTKVQGVLQPAWSQAYIGLAEAQVSQPQLASEDSASLHSVTRPVSLSRIQYQDIDPLEPLKPGDYGSPIWKTIGTSNIGSQEPHSLKVKESVPVRGILQDDLDIRSDISENSCTFSVVTNAESIFSLSVLSGSSMSSLHRSEDAANRLIELLLEDKIIHVLCCKALSSIDRERFERNLRRLLKGFATELRKEAKSKEQKSASHFVALRATNSAHMICNKLNQTRNGRINRVSVNKDPDDESEDGSDDSQSESSEDGLDGILQLEIFIKTSQSIQILRENLRSFVEQFDEQKRKANNEKVEKVEHVIAEEPRCLEVEERGLKVQEAETYWVQQVMAFCDEAVRTICQRPRPVGLGKTRIQWQCVSFQCRNTV
jgi:hypothetical protein